MIYFIECSGRIKIGFSLDAKSRLNKISADAPFPCKLLGVVPGDRKTEAEIQAKWKHVHCHREWFSASSELVSWISANAIVSSPKKFRLVKSGDDRRPHNKLCGFLVKRGDKTRIAKALGFRNSAVAQWKKFPPEYCAVISAILGVPRHELRPDIFERDAKGAAA